MPIRYQNVNENVLGKLMKMCFFCKIKQLCEIIIDHVYFTIFILRAKDQNKEITNLLKHTIKIEKVHEFSPKSSHHTKKVGNVSLELNANKKTDGLFFGMSIYNHPFTNIRISTNSSLRSQLQRMHVR